LTWEEMDELVTQLEKESEEYLEFDEIRNKIEEDYGIINSQAYERGLLIDEDMSVTDKHQVMMELSHTPMKSVKNIRNGVQFAYEKSDKNELKKIKDLFSGLEDMYVEDTEGFYGIEGVNIGYVGIENYGESDADISFYVLLDSSFEYKDIDKFAKKLDKLKVNGESVAENMRETYGIWIPYVTEGDKEVGINTVEEKIEYVIENYGKYEMKKNAVLKIETRIPLKSLGMEESSLGENGEDTINIDINGEEFELKKDESIGEGYINPEIK